MSIAERHQSQNVPAVGGPRLPYHPMIEERFGVDKASWKALVEAVFPGATTVESVILALSYCRARKLDPFKRNVHIVPIWDKARGCMVDTIWPGIGELRTTAFRTGEYAGRKPTEFGPDLTQKVGSLELTFPEWAQVTVCRMVRNQVVEFTGPRVYWLETYATIKRNDDTPNEMWATRTRGQIDKCAEAAALRAAFPEEVGCDYIPEEVQHQSRVIDVEAEQKTTIERISGNSLPDPDDIPEQTDTEPSQEDRSEPSSDTVSETPADMDNATRLLAQIRECETEQAVNLVRNNVDKAYKAKKITANELGVLQDALEDKTEAFALK